MSLYPIALFVHVVGAILLFATLTLEGIAIRLLRGAAFAREAATSAAILRVNRVLGPLAGFGLLVPGLYMTLTAWGLVPWIAVGLAAWALIAVLGAVNGIRILALHRALGRKSGPTTAQLRDPLFVASWSTRAGIALGVVFLMTVRPGLLGALVTVVVAAAAGLAVSLPGFSRIGSKEVVGAR